MLFAPALGTSGQTRADAGATGLQLSRTQLEEMLRQAEGVAVSAARSGQRQQATAEAVAIRERLDQGDFRVGDRIVVAVEGFTELSDTFPVIAGRLVRFPTIGDVPLAGVLRSELQNHLAAHVARYIREPRVHARSLMRLHVTGAVGRPGFYDFPSDILLTQALMLAGGPAGHADLERTRIKRNNQTVVQGEPVRQAIHQGWTLDQMSLLAGDAIDVAAKRNPLNSARNVLIALSTLASFAYFAKQVGLF